MCRLLYFPANSEMIRKIGKENLTAFLKQLEKSAGGDGNGIGFFTSKGEAKIFKGVNFKVEDAAEIIYNVITKEKTSSGVIFHTRRASVGNVSDELCHPFQGKGFLLAHNGHWAKYEDYALILMLTGYPILADYSDTYILAVVCDIISKKAGLDKMLKFIRKELKFDKWLLLTQKQIFHSDGLCKIYFRNLSGFILASEAPHWRVKDMQVEEPKFEFIFKSDFKNF